jgi:hypothetical protein
MLALIWLAAGAALGYFVVRRSVAFGLSIMMVSVAAATILAGHPTGAAWPPADSAGILVLLSLAPVGCALGTLLRARRLGQPSGRGRP